MTLKQFKEIIDKAAEKAGDCECHVEIWVGNKGYGVGQVGQFGFVPDVTITVGEKFADL